MKSTKTIQVAMQACAAAALLLVQGCASTNTISKTPQAIPADGVSTPATVRAVREAIHISISASGEKSGMSVAEGVKDSLEDQLAAEGFKVTPKDTDVEIALQGEATLYDQLGDFVVYKGTVSANVGRKHDGTILGKPSVTEKSERLPSDKEALVSLEKRIRSKIVPEVVKVLDSGTFGLEAANIEINHNFREMEDAEFIGKFLLKVNNVRGIVSCKLVNQDYARHNMHFRVVYFSDKFPEGIINAIITETKMKLKPVR